jgi:2-polyprenyl-3-methyl-5-hydroxy-6-metoxy-1,4-benzoquinol methylase
LKKVAFEEGMQTMSQDRHDFDKEAGAWDDHPDRVKLARDVAGAILRHVPVLPEMNVLDFGCGTGLVSFLLHRKVGSILAVDSSRGMLDVLATKLSDARVANVKTQLLDLDKGDVLTGPYDLIVSSMTFHHVPDIQPLLHQFYDAIALSGYLCVADLDPDKGLFHQSNDGVFHSGFERVEMRSRFEEAGFSGVVDVTAAEMTKTFPGGEERRFTVFLMIGRKGPGKAVTKD